MDLIKIKKEQKNILTQVNFFDIKNVPVIFMSAIKKSCKSEILSQIVSIHESVDKRLKTSDLNHWLRSEFSNESTIQSKKVENKIRYTNEPEKSSTHIFLFLTRKKFKLFQLRFQKTV